MKKEWLQSVGGILFLLSGLWSLNVHLWATTAVQSFFGLNPQLSRGLWELPILSEVYTLIIAAQGYEPAKWLVVPIVSQLVLFPVVMVIDEKLGKVGKSK